MFQLEKDMMKLGTFGAYTVVVMRPMHQKSSKEVGHSEESLFVLLW